MIFFSNSFLVSELPMISVLLEVAVFHGFLGECPVVLRDTTHKGGGFCCGGFFLFHFCCVFLKQTNSHRQQQTLSANVCNFLCISFKKYLVLMSQKQMEGTPLVPSLP